MSDIDWQHWHQVARTPERRPGMPGASISALGNQRLRVSLNKFLLEDLGWPADAGCQVFEGLGKQLGWLLLVRWSGDEQAPFTFNAMVHGNARLDGLFFEWAPDKVIKAEPVNFKVIDGGRAVALDLPAWFDRELFREAEAREARGR